MTAEAKRPLIGAEESQDYARRDAASGLEPRSASDFNHPAAFARYVSELELYRAWVERGAK